MVKKRQKKVRRIYLKRKGSEAFVKVEKKAPPSQPGTKPGLSAYAVMLFHLSYWDRRTCRSVQ